MDCFCRLRDCYALILRGIAAFFGAFTLLNLTGELVTPRFDATIWWLDVRGIPGVPRTLWLSLLGFALLRFAFARRPSLTEKLVGLSVVSPALLLATLNSVNCHRLVSQGVLQSRAAFSVSMFVTATLAAVTISLLADRRRARIHERQQGHMRAVVFAAFGCCIAFPLLQIHCFGKTDYRRQADVAVIFGCRVYADGRLSAALTDRVRTGVELYREGLVDLLVMSGGPGDGAVHETQAMRQYVIDAGVPAEQIVVDTEGWDTDRTVAGTVPLFRLHGLRRVLAVSHDFHLPRIKLAYARAGWNVLTVPARQRYRLPQRPFLLARETAALWIYYLRPLVRI